MAERLDDPICTLQVMMMYASRYTPETVEGRLAALRVAASDS